MSPKVQTTRMRVIGIAMTDLPEGGGRAQVVLVDTPGIFRIAKRRLERAMVAAAWQGAEDADVVALVVDAERGVGQETAGHRRAAEGAAGAALPGPEQDRPRGAREAADA